MAYRMPFVVRIHGKSVYINAAGETQCVEFVRQATGAPHTSLWKPGMRVQDAAPYTIEPGTAIATFVNGKYPTDGHGRHAAIYMSHDSQGIRVLDQWAAQGEVLSRVIRFSVPSGTRRSNDGRFFHVIEHSA